MALIIIEPETTEKAYSHAADIFLQMYQKVTGNVAKISADDEKSDLVIIGSDAVNDVLMNMMIDGKIADLKIRYGTDDYCIRTYKSSGRNILILAGGRGRSVIYSVYDYFERYCGCHYFWDGDVIPKSDSIPMENIDISESPRFEYRGLRYFAHRGLKRFQAEHWSFEDWKKEIDWMMKKRLNLFMLRIGMDDAWQRAFPDIVPYEEFHNETTVGYNDRSDFWSLKYRGELREKVMEYARKNDIMSMTDCGTMTHWYSKTPIEFLNTKKPKFLEQCDGYYDNLDRYSVFDFRVRENMDYYMRLTKTVAEEYDRNDYLFHTIGLGERRIYEDNKKNFALKKACYRRIMQRLREEYPNSKLFVGTWDFVGWWQPHEVQEFIKELDPERTVILDYTSEGRDEIQNFTNWGIVDKFPWIFGLFHAYEANSELRGPYARTAERLKIAMEDEKCKGMILWPELSHSDPIVLEYLSDNAWHPLEHSIEEVVEKYCKNRYGAYSEKMNGAWQKFLPFMMMGDWGGYRKKENCDENSFQTHDMHFTHYDLWTEPINGIKAKDEYTEHFYKTAIGKAKSESDVLLQAIKELSDIIGETQEKFILRDSIDIVRTVCGRFLNYMFATVLYDFCSKDNIKIIRCRYMHLMSLLSDLLSFNDDFSVYSTFEVLKRTAPVNPCFEKTLKENISNDYCRQYCTELIDYVLKQKSENVFDWFEHPTEIEQLEHDIGGKGDALFKSTPLKDMKHKTDMTIGEVMGEIAKELKLIKNVI